MTDELLNPSSDDLVNSDNPLVTTVTPACTDGTLPCDGDYQSETETEKPVLLELGTARNISMPVYSLDMHGTSAASYMSQHVQPAYLTSDTQSNTSALLATHIGIYSNPYTHPSANSVAQIRSVYPSHIPQTVCSWPATDLDNKGSPDIVPPPMYVSYVGSRELTIVKESNPSWKEKALQIEKDYKKTACDRERTRMRDMNRAFDLLRSRLPISKPNGKKYSKIESLRIAINYIHHLQECLKDEPPDMINFSASSKTSTQSSTEYAADSQRRSQIYQYTNTRKASYDEGDKTNEKPHNGAWSENSYIPNDQEQWD